MEIDISEGLVRAMLEEQHPDIAHRRLVQLDAGWDNVLWRLGDELLVRLPRRAVAAALTMNEQRWLPELAPRLPLPVPAPVRVGRPSGDYPWWWSVLPWLEGTPGDRASITDAEDAGLRLGRFLRVLHRPAPAGAPRNQWRGVPLVERADAIDERLARLADEVDVVALRRAWDRAVAAEPWSGAAVWVHGDLHPANVLIAEGTLAAVLDFGDLCQGDPATDVAAAWMLLPPDAMPVFATAYGRLDPDLLARSVGWAVLFGLMLVAVGLDGRPSYASVGRAILARVSAGPPALAG